MMAKDYMQLAVDEAARRRAQRDEQEIAEIANAMRHADETAELHRKVCALHGLDPATASPRMKGDCEIAFNRSRAEFISRAHPVNRGGFAVSEILSPESIVDEDRRAQAQVIRTKLHRDHAATWPPADLAERIGATDSITQSSGHSTARAA
jgi:hypothetical protein